MKITLITGGAPHYELGLISGLLAQNTELDVIGGCDIESSPILKDSRVRFRNFLGKPTPKTPAWRKLLRVARVYLRLMVHAAVSDARILHIQWPYKFPFFDRTLLLLYYKLCGKKLVFTAHNIDTNARDGRQSLPNRFSLHSLYKLSDRIIVHTEKMKCELMRDFCTCEEKIAVIPHGIMSAIPETDLKRSDARKRLGLPEDSKVVLAFGLIAPYKGIEFLVSALGELRRKGENHKLLIVGRVKECPEYWEKISALIKAEGLQDDTISVTHHVPDEDVEIYFKAADALVMSYRSLFQSGVLFLAFRFGMPIIATDVGSLREDIIDDKTGFICEPDNAGSLAQAIQKFFKSNMYQNSEASSDYIRQYANERYSWNSIGEKTRKVYEKLAQ